MAGKEMKIVTWNINSVRLRSPIVVDMQRDPLVIEGVVVGLIRNGAPV